MTDREAVEFFKQKLQELTVCARGNGKIMMIYRYAQAYRKAIEVLEERAEREEKNNAI